MPGRIDSAQRLLEGRAVGRGQLLRGSWEPGQQMGLPEPLTKPTNPSQAGPCEGPEPPLLPWHPEWSNRAPEGIHWSKRVWWVGAGRSGRGRRGGGFARLGPGELSQLGPRRRAALAFSCSYRASRLPDCWCAGWGRGEGSPLPKEPQRGARSRGRPPVAFEAEAQAPSSAAREEFNYQLKPLHLFRACQRALPTL